MRNPKLSKLEKSEKFTIFMSLNKKKSVQILMVVCVLYMLLVTLEIPVVYRTRFNTLSQDTLTRPQKLERRAPGRPFKSLIYKETESEAPTRALIAEQRRTAQIISRLKFDPETFDPSRKDESLELHESAKVAWEVGRKLWEDLESGKTLKTLNEEKEITEKDGSRSCPVLVSLSGSDLLACRNVIELSCGLTLGSHITVLILNEEDEAVKVSRFMLELQGLKAVEGEDPPRILHFNPRLKGDWSGKPVIEQNTCYRMHWSLAQRCEGWRSSDDEETVDGQVMCEIWIREDSDSSKEETKKAIWWLSHFRR
ncbi:hypothetical protein EUTSA_v10011115mg [Eutrema salsugineum]|uniref:Galectin n=1 Tax=Eutrema salsugineum TaxID=72664 RepID=V4L602_EUTSA|nr:hypothetical protein EUTSA_v10011115mg [Eutrema salsugineum]